MFLLSEYAFGIFANKFFPQILAIVNNAAMNIGDHTVLKKFLKDECKFKSILLPKHQFKTYEWEFHLCLECRQLQRMMIPSKQ